MQIWCPGCEWKPSPSSRWICAPSGCHHTWNTFDTGGVCPACTKVWKTTACLSCHKHYPHEDWYHDEGGVSLEAQIDLTMVEEVAAPVPMNRQKLSESNI